MKRLVLVFVALTVANSPCLLGQTESDPAQESRASKGFSQVVAELLSDLQGARQIKSATLMGAGLPTDQFESLTIDENGIDLDMQKRKTRFEFTEFRLASNTLLARSSSKEYPEGVVYEISKSDGIVKIRYRTNGTKVAPEQSAKDDQLLVQQWTRSVAK